MHIFLHMIIRGEAKRHPMDGWEMHMDGDVETLSTACFFIVSDEFSGTIMHHARANQFIHFSCHSLVRISEEPSVMRCSVDLSLIECRMRHISDVCRKWAEHQNRHAM
jgi:hypothetical protein